MVEVARRNTAAETVSQVVHPVGHRRKRALLTHLIKEGEWDRVLVFTRTKHGANRLATQLMMDGVSATAIHGNKSQSARTKALADFKKGSVRTLVATDIAARGLDIDSLPHVVNYDLPHVPEDYVHRIGRTGRAGASGRALSLVSAEEKDLLRGIQRLLGRDIDVEMIPGFEQEAAHDADHRAGEYRPWESRHANDGGHRRQPSRPGRGRGGAAGGRPGVSGRRGAPKRRSQG